ncbi:hypothetical protein Tco_1324026 [Tanacetum coccineum]
MEKGFLSPKGRGRGNGVKEKQSMIGDPAKVTNHVDEVTNALNLEVVKDGVIPGTIPAGNTPDKSSYANVISESINPSYYLIVANYVRKTWGKFGLVKSMLNSSTGLFSFQFSCTDGLNSMLENGQWFIRNHPLNLRKWNSDVDLLKEDVGNVLVWVKLHGVPVMAFSEDGLSAIAMKLGTPLMLDSYTSDMCLQS